MGRRGRVGPPPGRVVFLGDDPGTGVGAGRSELHVVGTDGRGHRKLTDNGTVDNVANYHVGPDGRTLVFEHFTHTAPEVTLDVATVTVDGVIENLTNQAADFPHGGSRFLSDARWAPDGSGFLISEQTGGLFSHGTIAWMSRDGSRIEPVLSADGAVSWKPRWSPDGTRFAFLASRDPEEGWKVHVANADGSGEVRVCHAAQCDPPIWTADGERLVFAATEDQSAGPWELWTVRADGSDLRKLIESAPGRRDVALPVLSPDGRRLVFTGWGEAGAGLYIASADGAGVEALVVGSGDAADFSFSPDGEWGVFDLRAGTSYIYIIELATGELRQLVDVAGARAPVWLPWS